MRLRPPFRACPFCARLAAAPASPALYEIGTILHYYPLLYLIACWTCAASCRSSETAKLPALMPCQRVSEPSTPVLVVGRPCGAVRCALAAAWQPARAFTLLVMSKCPCALQHVTRQTWKGRGPQRGGLCMAGVWCEQPAMLHCAALPVCTVPCAAGCSVFPTLCPHQPPLLDCARRGRSHGLPALLCLSCWQSALIEHD